MEFLRGIYPIQACLNARRRLITRLWLKSEALSAELKTIRDLATRQGVPVKTVSRKVLDEKAQNGLHQGTLLEVGALPLFAAEEFLSAQPKARRLLVLDQILDPQNLGALARSAYFFGYDALMITKRKSASLSVAASKASAGALETLPIIAVTNLTRALEQLKRNDFWIIGSDVSGQALKSQVKSLPEKCALLMGNEHAGARALSLKTCDLLLKIDSGNDEADSLNVSAAGAILMHALQDD